MWAPTKAVLIGKFIASNAYIPKEERSEINNQKLAFLGLKQAEEDTVKTRAKINEIINRKATESRADSLKDQ